MTQLITCAIAEHRLAVDVRQVREIVRRPRITPVPSGPRHIAGLINLRGRVLTIFDMSRCLEPAGTVETAPAYILIMRASDEVVEAATVSGPRAHYEQSGLLVDSIGEIATVEDTALCPPPANLPLGKVPFVPAVVEIAGRLHGVLGVEQLYAWAETGGES